MAHEPCTICKGFGKAQPIVDGKTDYSSLVFCLCQREKALTAAQPQVDHPDLDNDINTGHYYDNFDAGRQVRYRKNPAFKEELKELFGDVARLPEQNNESPQTQRKDGWRDLIALKAEVNFIRNKINEHLDKSKKLDWMERI